MLADNYIPDEILQRLPTPKGTAMVLTRECRREDVHLDDIAKLVRTDPALSGRLLAMANAAASGGRNIVAVDDAVWRLGLVTVCQVALAFSLIDQHGTGACMNFDYARYWSESILTAAACKELGTKNGAGVPGELFTVGLLSKVGQLALATASSATYSKLLGEARSESELLLEEDREFNTNHLKLSVVLMERWGVPSEYARPFALRAKVGEMGEVTESTLLGKRTALALTAGTLATAIYSDGGQQASQDPQCINAVELLDFKNDAVASHINSIEVTWRLWLGLIAK